MTLRPEIEALVQGALDGSLSPEDRQTLDRMLASDPSVRARAAELDRLAALLQSVGQVDAPPTFAADVLARIRASNDRVVEFSRGSKPAAHSASREGVAMNTKIIWGLAAAAVLVLAVVGYIANPSLNQGTEATIGTAQRYQAPQIEAKDVAVGDTSAQAVMQKETWDAIVKDETLRTLLQDASFRATLQDPQLRQAFSDADLLKALRSSSFAKALADPELARYLNSAESTKKLADENLRTALLNPALARALTDADVRAQLAKADIVAALARPAFQSALRDRGFLKAMSTARFGEALARGGDCDEFGCGGNSPIIGGAVIK
jgi:hypothetical protein